MKFIKLETPVLLPNIFRKGQEGSTLTIKRKTQFTWEDVAEGTVNHNGEVYIHLLREDVTIDDILLQMHKQTLEGRDY